MRFSSADRYLKAVKCLAIHTTCYAGASLAMGALNLYTGRPYWSVFPVVGWGVGLAIHALAVLGAPRLFSRAWEARVIHNWQVRQQGALPRFRGEDLDAATRLQHTGPGRRLHSS